MDCRPPHCLGNSRLKAYEDRNQIVYSTSCLALSSCRLFLHLYKSPNVIWHSSITLSKHYVKPGSFLDRRAANAAREDVLRGVARMENGELRVESDHSRIPTASTSSRTE